MAMLKLSLRNLLGQEVLIHPPQLDTYVYARVDYLLRGNRVFLRDYDADVERTLVYREQPSEHLNDVSGMHFLEEFADLKRRDAAFMAKKKAKQMEQD